MASVNSLAEAQWTQLVSIMTADMGTGKRLPTVLDVRKSAHLWTGLVPSVGVQLLKVTEDTYTTHTHMARCNFQIVAATQSVQTVNGSQRTPANLDDAMNQLQAIIDDGAGNGICAILRDKANTTLAGNAIIITIQSVDYSWSVQPGDQAEVMAYAIVTLETKQSVTIHS